MPRYLTWNIYHGAIQGQTPVQRIQRIVAVGIANAVDIICLQEVPQNVLDPTAGNFAPPGGNALFIQNLNANVANWDATYEVFQVFSETNPNHPPHAQTTDGYLIFSNLATFPNVNNFDYFSPDQFRDLTGAFLRPPVFMELGQANGQNVTVMNWHADVAAPQVASSLASLSQLIGNANQAVNPTVILGDYNYPGPLNNALLNPFLNWEDYYFGIYNANNALIANGLDHILTSGPAQEAIPNALGFRSDAYHFPFAVDM